MHPPLLFPNAPTITAGLHAGWKCCVKRGGHFLVEMPLELISTAPSGYLCAPPEHAFQGFCHWSEFGPVQCEQK